MWFAHSARRGRKAQLYAEHVEGVVQKADLKVRELLRFASGRNTLHYSNIVKAAASHHDLGKLSEPNQKVLSGKKQAKLLPVEHRDAGINHLLGSNKDNPAAMLVYAHHYPGLPNLTQEKMQHYPFRFSQAMPDTERNLARYLKVHSSLISCSAIDFSKLEVRLSPLEYRMLLSCLVDADYSDTAGLEPVKTAPKWSERLKSLDRYVAGLAKESKSDSERNSLRQELYGLCRSNTSTKSFEFCDSPVGTGKTTAVMARALKTTENNQLRRIIIILPYTNIISQTVSVLRKAVVLAGEDPYRIVAEHHHQADFESVELRHLAATWDAPIVVTTAVQFFETLASNLPAKLRKLHQLPGSYLIIDESHAVLPPSLLPLAWKWLTELTEAWGCRVCLSSGTTFRFWEQPEFRQIATREVELISTSGLARRLESFERDRLRLNLEKGSPPHFKGADELINYLAQFEGPRLVVLNTVRSAAYLAKIMRSQGKDVLHLSTALSPSDRELVIEEIKRRLNTEVNCEMNWTLVATSCVECGLDFSFRHGFCELRSVQSFFQLGGRVNRNAEYCDSSLNCFTILEDNFRRNPAFDTAQNVFRRLIERGDMGTTEITELISRGFAMETRLLGGLSDQLIKAERRCDFVDVAQRFKVIDEDTITVIVDPLLVDKLQLGEPISPRELQRGSVNLHHSTFKKLGLDQQDSELPYLTEAQYDNFLGYMKNI